MVLNLNMVHGVWVWGHNRNKSEIPVLPIVSSTWRAFRYHLGTVAKGSFIITLVKVPRLILMYLHNQLKGKVGSRGRPVGLSLWGTVCLQSGHGCFMYEGAINSLRRTPVTPVTHPPVLVSVLRWLASEPGPELPSLRAPVNYTLTVMCLILTRGMCWAVLGRSKHVHQK